MTLPMESMYREIILDHYKNPQHRGLPEAFDAEVHHVNPTCGDEVTVRVRVADGRVEDVSYEGQGCSISQAATSVLTELVVGRTVDDAVAFEGVSKYPARVKCALLGWMAMTSAVADAEGNS